MKNKAFTLVELLAVIVVLGIIIVIAIPSFTKVDTNTKDKIFVNNTLTYVSDAKNDAILKKLDQDEYALYFVEDLDKNNSYNQGLILVDSSNNAYSLIEDKNNNSIGEIKSYSNDTVSQDINKFIKYDDIKNNLNTISKADNKLLNIDNFDYISAYLGDEAVGLKLVDNENFIYKKTPITYSHKIFGTYYLTDCNLASKIVGDPKATSVGGEYTIINDDGVYLTLIELKSGVSNPNTIYKNSNLYEGSVLSIQDIISYEISNGFIDEDSLELQEVEVTLSGESKKMNAFSNYTMSPQMKKILKISDVEKGTIVFRNNPEDGSLFYLRTKNLSADYNIKVTFYNVTDDCVTETRVDSSYSYFYYKIKKDSIAEICK